MAHLPSKALTKKQRAAVAGSWDTVKALGTEQVGVLLFKEIFRLSPEALQLFSFRGEAQLYEGAALKSHGAKVVAAVGTVVAQLGDETRLTTLLRTLSLRHAFMGLREAHFEVVGQALLATLRAALGAAFTAELEAAWAGFYSFMQQTMLSEIANTHRKMDSIMEGAGEATPKVAVDTPTTASEGGSESPSGTPPGNLPFGVGDGRGEVEPTYDGKIVEGQIRLSTHLWATRMSVPEKQQAKDVDERDKDTPDSWVKRHPEMVRLTGRHPFNSEPPLRRLQEAGWVTPASLHVVRNHGAVPKSTWETHRLKISGVPRGDCELSMDDLASGKVGPVVSIPVTFICAGNRRKEQNMTKKTIGFNWGAAAVANSVWTGVRLCDVLAYLGITRASEKHQYVHFAGPLGELPQGADGSYGTSIAIGWALDRERDVLLAFKQNGEPLTPDHGAPLRTLLPGCIGGRMIKWLTTMSVSDRPSESHYHFFDNRVLPPHVDAELATAEGWWYKPEYIINHININSAMFEPRHNAFFPLGPPVLPSEISDYIVILDAGSTGTRAQAFHYPQRVLRQGTRDFVVSRPLTLPKPLFFVDTVPGISSFRNDPSGLYHYLLVFAEKVAKRLKKHDDKKNLAEVPIYLGATAGMRNLDEAARQRLFTPIREALHASPFSFGRTAGGEGVPVFERIAM